MSTCKNYVIELFKQAKEIKFEDRYKGISSNPLLISDEDIQSIMKGENITELLMNKFFGKFKTYTVRRTINGGILQAKPKDIDEDKIEKNVGNQVREVANEMLNELEDPKLLLIGLKEVLGSIAEISDVVNKSSIDPKNIDKLKDEHGNFYARWNQYAKVIGLQYLQANGKKIPDSKANEQLLIDTGSRVLDLLAKYGYINKYEGGEYKVALNQERVFNETTQEYEYKKSDNKDSEFGIHTVKKAFTLNNEKFSKLYMIDKTNPEQVYKERVKMFGGLDEEGQPISGILRYDDESEGGIGGEVSYVLKKDYDGDGDKKEPLSEDEKLWIENHLLYDYVSKLSKTFIPQNITHIRHHSIMKDKKVDEISTEQKLKKESDMALTGNIEEANKILESKPYFLDKTLFTALMPFVKRFVEKGEYDYHSFLQDNMVQTFLGIEKNEYHLPRSKEEINSKSGSDRTKVDNFMQLVAAIADDIDEYIEDKGIGKEKIKEMPINEIYKEIFSEGAFYIGKKRGRNARTYLMEVAISPETDKHFTRHFTNTSENKHKVQILSSDNKLTKEFSFVITHLLNEVLGIKDKEFANKFIKAFINKDLEFLYNKDLPSKQKEFLSLLNVYMNKNENDLEHMITSISKIYKRVKEKTKKDPNYKPISRLQILKFAQEYKAYKNKNKSNTFETNISPELDDNSSGITIKIMQEAELGNKYAQHLLYRFGMKPNEKGEYISTSDPEYLPGAYEVVMETMDKMLSDKEDKKYSVEELNEDIEAQEDLTYDQEKEIEDLFKNHNDTEEKNIYGFGKNSNSFTLAKKIWNGYAEKLGIGKRDMAKYPTMIIGAYNMDVSAANRENVVKPMFQDFKSKWLSEPELFKEFVQMLADSGTTIIDDNLKSILDENKEITTEDVAKILTNKKSEFFIKQQLEWSIGKMLSIVAYNEFKYKLFQEDNKTIKDVWEEYQNVYKNDTSMYKIADLNIVDTNSQDISNLENDYENSAWNNSKNYLHLTKQVEVWNPETETTFLNNIPNINTLVVSLIHMYDASTLHDAILTTRDRIKNEYGKDSEMMKEWNNTNILTIHDAVILSPKIAEIFQQEFIKAKANLIHKFPKRLLFLSSFMLNMNKRRFNNLWKKYKEEFKEENPYYKNGKINKLLTDTIMSNYNKVYNAIVDNTNNTIREGKGKGNPEFTKKSEYIKQQMIEFEKKHPASSGLDFNDYKKLIMRQIFKDQQNKLYEQYFNKLESKIKESMDLDVHTNSFEELGFKSQEELNLFNDIKSRKDKVLEQVSNKPILANTSKEIKKITGKVFGDPLVEYTHDSEQETTEEPSDGNTEPSEEETDEIVDELNNINSEEEYNNMNVDNMSFTEYIKHLCNN